MAFSAFSAPLRSLTTARVVPQVLIALYESCGGSEWVGGKGNRWGEPGPAPYGEVTRDGLGRNQCTRNWGGVCGHKSSGSGVKRRGALKTLNLDGAGLACRDTDGGGGGASGEALC